MVSLLLTFSSSKRRTVNSQVLQQASAQDTCYFGSTPLHLVVRRSGVNFLWRSEILELLCKSGACITIRDGDNKTILFYMLQRHVHKVDCMLKTMRPFNDQSLVSLLNEDCYFCSYIHDSAKIRLLLDYGADPNIHLKHDKQSLIFWVLEQTHFMFPKSSLDTLLTYGTDFETPDKNGKSLLHQAVQIPQSSFSDLDYLLNTARLNINTTDSNGLTPLEYSIDELNRDAISYLIHAGAYCQLTRTRIKKLFYYVFDQHIADGLDIIQFLYDMDPANINCRYMDNLQRTPLHVATRSRTVNVLRKLIQLGANVNAKDAEGKTPMEFALDNNPNDIVIEILLTAGAVVPKICSRKAMWIGVELSEMLVRTIAKTYPKLVDMECDGKALLVKAAGLATNATNMVRLLIENGVRLKRKNAGKKAVDVAIENGNFELLMILVGTCPDVADGSWKMDKQFGKLVQTDFQEAFASLIGATRNNKVALSQFRTLLHFMLAEYDLDLDLHCGVLKKSFDQLMLRIFMRRTCKFEFFGKNIFFEKKNRQENLTLASSIEILWRKKFTAKFEKLMFLWIWKYRAKIFLPSEVQQFIGEEWG
ncbi:hypothetical protein HK096_006517 [Nowakowskiella sp. JEL0078]|nr:hypothetical protein HK096_006517 [Nowakowskiella sp. JEL0078]